ncbi:MAG: S9 family peptidase [Bryobacterales bacterium]|nr:S9 family peptidase [Bryobacterales bacterium]
MMLQNGSIPSGGLMPAFKTINRSGLLLLFCASIWAADTTLPVPSNLKVQGIPSIPTALADRLAQYGEFRTASLLDWHPTKREILILTRFGDVPQLHRVLMPGGAREQLTFFPERVTGALYQPGSGTSFLYAKDIGGSEFYQLFLFDLQSGTSRMLTDGKSRNTSPQWSHDGSRIAFASSQRNGRDMDIYVIDAKRSGPAKLLLQVQGGGWYPTGWFPDNSRIVLEHYTSINESAIHLLDPETGATSQLTPSDQVAAYENAALTPDGKGAYIITDRDSEFRRLAYIDLATKQFAFLRPELKWDVTALRLSRDGRKLAYVVNEDGADTLHVMDTATRRNLPLPKLAYGSFTSLSWHNDSREVGFSLASAKSPSDIYSIDVEKGTLERWTKSETGGLNTDEFVEPELIRWKSFDGLTISGFLYMPPAKFAGQRPVIINIHGGPESQFQPGFLGRNNYYVNELGMAMIFPNVRGSSGYGKTFLKLDNGKKREDSVRDIGALLDWIAARRDLDAKRVMVMGGSYGGYMTLASMTHYNDRLCCAIDVVGISNFVTFLERTEAYRRDLRRAEYGDERDPGMRDLLISISPVTNVRKITKPLLVVQGQNDPRVPAHESLQMVEAIRKNGGRVWFLMAEDEGHGFAKKKNQDFQFAASTLFIEQHLAGANP